MITDLDLLTLGCGVTFIAAAGAYVYLRERFLAAKQGARSESEGDASARQRARRAA